MQFGRTSCIGHTVIFTLPSGLSVKKIAAIFSAVKAMTFRTPAFTIRVFCGYVVSVFHKILGCCRFNIVKITVGGNSVKFLKPYSPRRRAKP